MLENSNNLTFQYQPPVISAALKHFMVKIPSNDAKIMKQKLEIYTSDVDLMADLLKKIL